MDRARFTWALQAVLPHCGTAAQGLDYVGLASECAYATDRYTLGIAGGLDLGWIDVKLQKKEAQELMRFVRPSRKDEHTEDVVLRHVDNELHVGLVDSEDSAVFELTEGQLHLDSLHAILGAIRGSAEDHDMLVYQPALFERFAKVKRDEMSRILLHPHVGIQEHGRSLIVTSHDFVGAIAGMDTSVDLTDYLLIGVD